mgnify:FL=1
MPEHAVRIPPLHPTEFSPEQKDVVGDWGVLNFSRVLARHPALYRVFVPFIEKVISFTDLPPWDREVLVIRALDQCGDVYEASHHVDIAYKVGMTDAQIASVKAGGADLSECERCLIRAADALVHEHCVSDATWQALAERYSTIELMEVVGLVGCYTTIAMVTRSFEMQLESKDEVARELAALRTYT